MIYINKHHPESELVEDLDIDAMHGYIPVCRKCWRPFSNRIDARVWFYDKLMFNRIKSSVRLPCGHYVKIEDLNADLVFIDEWIAAYVAKINRGGYRTNNSCSGHADSCAGYVQFDGVYDDLVDFIKHRPDILDYVDLEFDDADCKRKKIIKYVYNQDTKTFKVSYTMELGNKELYTPHICIRMKDNLTIGGRKTSRFMKLIKFRTVLNAIAKWCATSKTYKYRGLLRKGKRR